MIVIRLMREDQDITFDQGIQYFSVPEAIKMFVDFDLLLGGRVVECEPHRIVTEIDFKDNGLQTTTYTGNTDEMLSLHALAERAWILPVE